MQYCSEKNSIAPSYIYCTRAVSMEELAIYEICGKAQRKERKKTQYSISPLLVE